MTSPEAKPQIIFIPGLGDNIEAMTWATKGWKKMGVETHISRVGWYDGEDFEPKLERMLVLIDELHKRGKVYVIGSSAGGSFAFNVFRERQDVIEKAVNNCGRLRRGNPNRTFRSLESVSQKSPAFKQSVLQFEASEHLLTKQDRARLMTIRPAFGDEAVPPETVPLEGAHNTLVYTPEHILGIGLSLLFPQTIFDFLDIYSNS